MTITPEDFIANLLEWDVEPPYSDYSHIEYAAAVSRQLSPAEVGRLAGLAVKLLFASLASDVLDGLFESCPDAFTPSVAMQWLPHGFDVNSAASVVRFMMERLSVTPDDALDFLLQRIEREREEQVQNGLAYACWWIVNGRTILLPEDKLVGCLFTPVDQRLEQILASDALSSYARETLRECKSA